MGSLRFLLALSVVVGHSYLGEMFGHRVLLAITAVQGFYIVSGFLITMVLNTRKEYLNIGNFYVSRYLRLWPAYIVVATLSIPLFRGTDWFSRLAKLDLPAGLFVIASNCVIFFQDTFLFLVIGPDGSLLPSARALTENSGFALAELLLVPQAWTLGIELVFYLIAPFICRSPWRLLGLFIVGAAVRVTIGTWSPDLDPWSYRFAPAEMTFFALGGLSYFAGSALRRYVRPFVLRATGTTALIALTVIVLALPVTWATFTAQSYTYNQSILLLIAGACPFLMAFSDGKRWDSLIGELSYPIYLCHPLVHNVLRDYLLIPPASNHLAYFLAVFGFSALLVWLVVLPVDRYRRQFGARVP
jgi:peptidoglycan/LPS O-acetylase OafA/YrhL